MKKGDLVLLARTNLQTKTKDRLVGEITNYIDGFFIIRTSLLTLKINPTTLEVVSDNLNYKYRYSGIVK